MARPTPVTGLDPRGTLTENASRIIRFRLSDVLALTARVRDPEDAGGLHDLRIAVKRLRYALEFLGPAYDGPVKKALAKTVELQESLGRVTDCDAFLRRLGAYDPLLEGEEREGLESLIERVRRARGESYIEAVALVARAESEGLWSKLLRAVE